MKYFSYGSNMSPKRMKERAPSAKIIGCYRLDKHDLRFHKISKKDGSAKCDAYLTGSDEDFVLGVLYEIGNEEEETLRRYEGVGNGYDEKEVSVHSDGQTHQAITYVATNTSESLKPYSWYVRHVLEGAKAAKFPDDYMAMIEGIAAQKDDDPVREKDELSIYR